jgi:hypothetical protein
MADREQRRVQVDVAARGLDGVLNLLRSHEPMIATGTHPSVSGR